jgi:beta-lactamase regulating signal transducer with metallopeptidase domain
MMHASIADAWLAWVVPVSWQIALLVAAIAALAILTRRLSARFRYALWSLVLLKVLLSPALTAPWSIGHWIQTPMPSRSIESSRTAPTPAMSPSLIPSAADRAIPATQIATSSPSPTHGASMADDSDATRSTGNSAASRLIANTAFSAPSTAQALFYVWLAGVALLLGLIGARYWRTLALLRRAERVEEGPLRVVLERLCLELGAPSPPALLLSDRVASPFLIGLFRPRIVIPADFPARLQPHELEDVLLHELIHWRRRDLWIAWLQVGVQVTFWFHPLVWWANRQLQHERECACDESVLATGRRPAAAYAESLLRVLLAARGRAPLAVGFLGILEQNVRLQKRLSGIMDQESGARRFGALHWTLLAALAVVVLPMASPAQPAQEAVASAAAQGTSIDLRQRIADAQPNAVIDLPPGTHAGPILIDKPLTLRGAGMDATTIELLADEPAIFIRGVEDVTLERLAVRWSNRTTDARFEYPAAIAVRDANVTIRDCRLEPIERPLQTPNGLLVAGRSSVVFSGGRAKGFAYAILFTQGAGGIVSDSLLVDADHSEVTLHENSAVRIERNILGGCDYHAVRNTGGTMDMRDNIVFGCNRAGAYLGNKAAHGRIENNLFLENDGGIWGYYDSDVTVERNLFVENKNVAVSFWTECALVVRNNIFMRSPNGVIRYREGESRTQLDGNLYWGLETDTKDIAREANALAIDPGFADILDGKLTPTNPQAAGKGLSRPEAIEALVPLYMKNVFFSGGRNRLNDDAPRIVSLTPANGAIGVDPKLAEIVVTFDRDMDTGGYSWVRFGASFPPTPDGKTAYWRDKRTCVLPVALEAGRVYLLGVNDANYQNFRSVEGVPAAPMVVEFRVAGGDTAPVDVRKPWIVSLEPANGATDVDPALTELRVTFDTSMASGVSWTGGGENFPTIPEGQTPHWTEDRKTCILPVKLKPNWQYKLGINSPSFKNFQSLDGVPVDPTLYTFSTRP